MTLEATGTDNAATGGGAGAGDGVGAGAGGQGGAAAPGAAQPWYIGLPESLRSNPSVTKYGSLEDLVIGYINQGKLIGKDPARIVELPEDDAGRMALLRRLGAPEKPEDYRLRPIENLDPSVGPDGPLAKTFIAAAHKHGLLPAQVQGIYEDVAKALNQAIIEDDKAAQEQATQVVEALKKEWGPAFDQKVARAKLAVERLAARAGVEVQQVGELQADPTMLRLLSVVGDMLVTEDTAGGQPGLGRTLAPAEAQAEAHRLMERALNSADQFERKRLSQEADRLFKMAFPDNAA